MCRAIVAVLTGIMLVIALSPPAYASYNAAHKLGRGIANIATAWFELPLEVGRKTINESELAGIFVAPITGSLKVLGRALAGVYDVATFLIPLPARYEPLIEPEFVFWEK